MLASYRVPFHREERLVAPHLEELAAVLLPDDDRNFLICVRPALTRNTPVLRLINTFYGIVSDNIVFKVRKRVLNSDVDIGSINFDSRNLRFDSLSR